MVTSPGGMTAYVELECSITSPSSVLYTGSVIRIKLIHVLVLFYSSISFRDVKSWDGDSHHGIEFFKQ